MNELQSDIIFSENENSDVLSPAKAIAEITYIVAAMIEENIAYVAKSGMTEKARSSRERLIKLLNITENFNQLSNQNSTLKTWNRQLSGENQKLKSQLAEIERQYNMANSIE
jgi:predicted RNase H-like nuclease (RuvC/YqgF family)